MWHQTDYLLKNKAEGIALFELGWVTQISHPAVYVQVHEWPQKHHKY